MQVQIYANLPPTSQMRIIYRKGMAVAQLQGETDLISFTQFVRAWKQWLELVNNNPGGYVRL